MIVISLVNPPRSLHGDLSKWLLEINTNVYVGNVNARVREALWDRITASIKTGQATMVYTTNNEQGMDFKVWGTTWKPTEFDGLILMQKPFPKSISHSPEQPSYIGNSKYSRFRKFGKSPNLSPVSENEGNKTQESLFAVIDIETTGLNPQKDRIIEIGCIIADQEQIYEQRNFLIKTDLSISTEIEKLTGITKEMLEEEGISLENSLKELSALTANLQAIFHNAPFDLKFLTLAFKKAGLKIPVWKITDTMILSKKILSSLDNYRLQTVCEFLKCTYMPSHRALPDCLAAWEAYVKLMNFASSS